MNLNKEDVIILIQEYQKRRVLWDAKDKWHFNKNKKNDSWNEIAECLNISVDDAKKKISSLLGSFRREKAKGRKTLGTGKGAKDIYKSDWFAFNSFGFLMDKDDPRETVSSEDWKEDETVEAVELIEESGEDNIPISKSSESDNIQSPECAAKTTKRVVSRQEKVGTSAFRKPSTPKKRRKEKEDPRIEQAFQLLQQPIPEENSSTIYAKYLADQLEKFSPVTQAVLKHKINALIFDAEMEKYNAQRVENPYTASILSQPTSFYSPAFASRPTSTGFGSPAISTGRPSPVSSPASTTPVSEILRLTNEALENSSSTDSQVSADKVALELTEFVYLTDN